MPLPLLKFFCSKLPKIIFRRIETKLRTMSWLMADILPVTADITCVEADITYVMASATSEEAKISFYFLSQKTYFFQNILQKLSRFRKKYFFTSRGRVSRTKRGKFSFFYFSNPSLADKCFFIYSEVSLIDYSCSFYLD